MEARPAGPVTELMRKGVDIVIVDAPPLDAALGDAVFGSVVGTSLPVTERRNLRWEASRACVRLPSSPSEVDGLVLTSRGRR